MPKLKIGFLSDDYDCDECGASYAEGARVYLDNKLILERLPVAHCFGGSHWDTADIYKEILGHLGYEVEEVYGENAIPE